MKPFFNNLFAYNHHFNQRLIEAISASPGHVSPKAVQLISHIVNAHQIWNNRIDPVASSFGVWEVHAPRDLQRIDEANFTRTLEILGDAPLQSSVQYTNSTGRKFTNTVGDIFFHIINHSTYHRGQLATEFRRCGHEPLVTDYVFHKRSN